MKVLAISAANIKHQPEGTSVRIANRVLDDVKALRPDIKTKMIALVDKDIHPCNGCGKCARSHECKEWSDDFPFIYRELLNCDGLIIVAPHYAPIPAKLCALLERTESISFLGWWNDPEFVRPLAGKPFAVIGHSGGTPETWSSYYEVIMTPIKNALGFPVEMEPVNTGEWPNMGALVGPTEVRHEPGAIFPIQIYDEDVLDGSVRKVARALVDAMETRKR